MYMYMYMYIIPYINMYRKIAWWCFHPTHEEVGFPAPAYYKYIIPYNGQNTKRGKYKANTDQLVRTGVRIALRSDKAGRKHVAAS